MSLSIEEQKIIEEEMQLLAQTQSGLYLQSLPSKRTSAYQDIIELRDSLSEIRTEDVPSVIAHMERLILLEQQGPYEVAVVDVKRPYFAHLRLREGRRTRDVLIGESSCTSEHLPYPIIDWKNAPLSRIFYRYEEEEEYVEEIANREVEGVVVSRRTLLIEEGQLKRIECPAGKFVLEDGVWQRFEYQPARLQTIETSAAVQRWPQAASAAKGGVDKHLRDITALIDPDQFDVITQPESGVVVIQGGPALGKPRWPCIDWLI